MNVTTSSFSPAQMILAWTLLGLLMSWLILFTTLALREFVTKKVESEDVPTLSRPILDISTQPDEEQRQYVEVVGGNIHYESIGKELS